MKALAGCVAAVAGVFAFGSAASATTTMTFSYTTASLVAGMTDVVTPPGVTAGVGQIDIPGTLTTTDSGPPVTSTSQSKTEFLYCLDLYNGLKPNDTFTLEQVDLSTDPVIIPHAAAGGNPLSLSKGQVQQIGSIIANGFDGSGGGPFSTGQAEDSAATQLAIWLVEYTTVTLTPTANSITAPAAYAAQVAEINAIDALAATKVANSLSDTTGPGANAYDVTIFVPDKTSSQDLSFATVHTFVNTPLPGTLPLFVSGLGGLGMLGWRRIKRKAS